MPNNYAIYTRDADYQAWKMQYYVETLRLAYSARDTYSRHQQEVLIVPLRDLDTVPVWIDSAMVQTDFPLEGAR